MRSSVASRSAFLPSLSPAAAGALPPRLRRGFGGQVGAGRARKSPQTPTLPLASFRSTVWGYWRESGRHDLPWRKTKDPYRILVSEVMLQQTQVDRVVPKYREFLKALPTVRHLARAPLGKVLRVWSGVGYNRRAKYLRDTAKVIVEKHGGRVPLLHSELVELPGIGLYTASAIRVFAFNEPDILIETNIRTALIHSFFSNGRHRVQDADLVTLLSKVVETENGNTREWHWALMDYGAYLKRSGVRNNHRSAHYVRQSKFEGSLRQLRGAILRTLSKRENIMRLRNHYMNDLRSRSSQKFERVLEGLERDGLIAKRNRKWCIA